jgi:hypothetical protein
MDWNELLKGVMDDGNMYEQVVVYCGDIWFVIEKYEDGTLYLNDLNDELKELYKIKKQIIELRSALNSFDIKKI